MSFKQRLKPSAEFSSSSIADLVFLLLIFFMLTSTFVNQSGVKVDLPKGKSTNQNPAKNTVTLTEDGNYVWNSEVLGEGLEVEDRERLVRERIAEVLTDADEENNVITLRVDKAVTMGVATAIIEEVSANGGSIVIQTELK